MPIFYTVCNLRNSFIYVDGSASIAGHHMCQARGHPMANLQVRGVHKRFGATPILHGVDIDVADGEFLTLVGPSGCGKSTLLRLIGGLEEISDGEIQIGGRRVNEVPPK